MNEIRLALLELTGLGSWSSRHNRCRKDNTMLSRINTYYRRNFQNHRRYVAFVGIFVLGILSALVGVIVIISDLIMLALSALQSVVGAIAHSSPIVQVVLLLLVAYAIKQNWPILKRWVWRLLH